MYMQKPQAFKRSAPWFRPAGKLVKVAVLAVSLAAVVLFLQGCFDQVSPQLDREERVLEALNRQDNRTPPPSPLTPSAAVVYALQNNLDAQVAEIEIAYHTESVVAARRRLLPSLDMRYSVGHSNHPAARWSRSASSGKESLESSYSSDPDSRQGEVGLIWNILDFGVGYLKAQQQGERVRNSLEQYRRVRQQVVLDVLSQYWRASAAVAIAEEAELLRAELEEQAEAVRDSVEMRILSGAEGARRELAVHAGLAELEQWRRMAVQARLELARTLGCASATQFTLAQFPEVLPDFPALPENDPAALQTAALQRRPELFQQDTQERVALTDARLALLQMAPNASLSLNLYDDPDMFLEWNNWMTVGAKASWNLFNIPARVSEKRMAELQGEAAHRKGLALAVGIMAQVGIAYSECRLTGEYASTLQKRAAARGKLVEALAAGERDGQTRPGEVLQERVRLLSERSAMLRAIADARVAEARLANAIGLDIDDNGRLLWDLVSEQPVDLLACVDPGKARIRESELHAAAALPATLAGVRVVGWQDFESSDEYFGSGEEDNTANLKLTISAHDTPDGAPTP